MPVRFTVGKKDKFSKWSSFLGGLICTGFFLTGMYVVIWGDTISGGIPFLSDTLNYLFGKIFIGFGALFCGGLAIYAFREMMRK